MKLALGIWCVAVLVHLDNAHDICYPASYYSDHMVLQQQPNKSIIWGYGDFGAIVEVKLAGKVYNTTVVTDPLSETGIWKVELDPMPAGGPFEIDIFCKADKVVNSTRLVDVLFGDVWVCSGQSNMAFAVDQSVNGSQELNDSVNFPNIRLLAVKQVESNVILDDFQGLYEPWTKPTPDTLGGTTHPFMYFSALCWFFGRDLYNSLQYPIGLISSNWGGTSIQVWSSPDVIKACGGHSNGLSEPEDMNYPGLYGVPMNPSVLWNAMIHPLLNFTIKGVIWYQGEANTIDPDPYKCLFNAMITDWRNKWHEGTKGNTDIKFPFGFMQLCTSNNPSSEMIGPYTALRWHQTYDYGYTPNIVMHNVFMAVAIDLPDLTSPSGPIHPRDKQDMGTRLALSGRAVAYGHKVTYAGPFPTSVTVAHLFSTLTIQYDKGTAQIQLVGKTGFEVCCGSLLSPCKYYNTWVPATILNQPDPSSVRLSYNCFRRSAVGVRYLWRDMPCTFKNCPVYSVNNTLPGPPFILNV